MMKAPAILAILIEPRRHVASPDFQSILELLLVFVLVGLLSVYFHYFPPRWRRGERLSGFIVGVPVGIFGVMLLGDVALYSFDKLLPHEPFGEWLIDSLGQILLSWLQPSVTIITGLLIGGAMGALFFRRRRKTQPATRPRVLG